ncbi:type VII secretion system-associated protein [Streptomyces seoulensis]
MRSDLTKLDAPALLNFVNVDLAGFRDSVKQAHTVDGPDYPKPFTLANDAAGTLRIGRMASDDATAGKDLVGAIQKAASGIDTVLNKHVTAFTHLMDSITQSVHDMLSTQGKSLEQIDGQQLLTALSPYTTDMGGDSAGSGS